MLEIVKQPDICVGCGKYDEPNFLQRLIGKRACKGPIIINYDSSCSVGDIPSLGVSGSKDFCRDQDRIDLSIIWKNIGRKLLPTVLITKPTQLGIQTYEREVWPQNAVIAEREKNQGIKTTSLENNPPGLKVGLNDKYAGRNMFLESNMPNPTTQEWPWNFQPSHPEEPKPKQLYIAPSAEPTLRDMQLDRLRYLKDEGMSMDAVREVLDEGILTMSSEDIFNMREDNLFATGEGDGE